MLRTYDGYLSLRTGPDTSYDEVARLLSGQPILVDDRRGDREGYWWHVTGVIVGRHVRPTHGWASSLYLIPIDCRRLPA